MFKELKIRTEHEFNFIHLLLSNRFTKLDQLDNNHPGIGQEI